MKFSIFDLFENKLSAKNISNEILPRLQKKYNEQFEIVRIGSRYGDLNDEDGATIYVKVINNPTLVFSVRVTYEENEYKFEDNYNLKSLTNKLDKILMQKFKENAILSIIKTDIIGNPKIKNPMSLEEFSKKYPTSNFLSNIILSGNYNIKKVYEIFENVNNILPGLYLKTLIYIIDEKDFYKINEEAKTLTNITKAMIKRYNIKDEKIIKIQNGKVQKIK